MANNLHTHATSVKKEAREKIKDIKERSYGSLDYQVLENQR